jgi:hypothetical protein
MSKTLADLRKEKDQRGSLPTRIVTICLDQELLADIQRLTAEKRDLEADLPRSVGVGALDPEIVDRYDLRRAYCEDDDQGEDATPARPRRQGEGGKVRARLDAIAAELEPLYQRLRDTEGELLIRASDGGSWLRWKDAHPAREGSDVDERLSYGFCNATDLAADLGRYVVSWNGEEFAPGEWGDWFAAKVAPADIGECVRAVVELHEARVGAPKSPSTSSVPETSETA